MFSYSDPASVASLVGMLDEMEKKSQQLQQEANQQMSHLKVLVCQELHVLSVALSTFR